MPITLDELIQNRKDLISIHKKNNFTSGLHALLTDLYPDTAHFVYELLQNAEDMNATEVKFFLENDSLRFEHNGTKRTFNVQDIDAITSIGNNAQKKDDPTSIGKFGIGFKSVFAYTKSPEIHSGQYHFRIRDYFVPEFDNVIHINTMDDCGVEWTKFCFPFDNPKKPKSVAFREVYDSISNLNSSSIMFLKHIHIIQYSVLEGDVYTVELDEIDDNIIKVSKCLKGNEDRKPEYWLRYQKQIKMLDEHRDEKNLNISIAYRLMKIYKSNDFKIAKPEDVGKVFIYFPAEKENSKLKFYINAPFASTVARDGIRSCKENIELMKHISNLVAESIGNIKSRNMLNAQFLSLLPTYYDGLGEFYIPIIDALKQAFKQNEYLPLANGKFSKSGNAIWGDNVAASNVSEDIIYVIEHKKMKWIEFQSSQHIQSFLKTIDVLQFSYEKYFDLFITENKEKLNEILTNMNDKEIASFYAFSHTALRNVSSAVKERCVSSMKSSCIVRNSHNQLCYPSEIYIAQQYDSSKNNALNYVKYTILNDAIVGSDTLEDVKSFLKNTLEIKEYGAWVEVRGAINRIKSHTIKNGVPDWYFSDFILIAKHFDAGYDSVDDKMNIFLFASKNGIAKDFAHNLVLGKKYGNKHGEELAKAIGKKVLWNGYFEKYKEEDIKTIISFAKKCGIIVKPKIICSPIEMNPMYYKKTSGIRYRTTASKMSSDYNIDYLEEIVKSKSFNMNRMIWDLLIDGGARYGDKFSKAQFMPNLSAPTIEFDSSLIIILKREKWIPDKSGVWHSPKNIRVEDIHSDFYVPPNNSLIKALKIGESFDKATLKMMAVEKEAEEIGCCIVTKEEREQFDEFLCYKRRTEESDRKKSLVSIKEMMISQTKEQSECNSYDFITTEASAKSIQILDEKFENLNRTKPVIRRLFSRIESSTAEEKKKLRVWYQGACQMCGTVIVNHKGKSCFFAKNIIATDNFPGALRDTIDIGWNSICLCPNCAMKYKVCSRDISQLYDQIISIDLNTDKRNEFSLFIKLGGDRQEIRFKRIHFTLLQSAIILLDKSASSKNSN